MRRRDHRGPPGALGAHGSGLRTVKNKARPPLQVPGFFMGAGRSAEGFNHRIAHLRGAHFGRAFAVNVARAQALG